MCCAPRQEPQGGRHTGVLGAVTTRCRLPRGQGARLLSPEARTGWGGVEDSAGEDASSSGHMDSKVSIQGQRGAPNTLCSCLLPKQAQLGRGQEGPCAALRTPQAQSRGPSRVLPRGQGASSQPSETGRECQPAVGGGQAVAVLWLQRAQQGQAEAGLGDRTGREKRQRDPGMRTHGGRAGEADNPIPRGTREEQAELPTAV